MEPTEVIIPCPHDHDHNYSNLTATAKIIDVWISYRVHERAIFTCVETGDEAVTPFYTRNHGVATTLRVDPYCPSCVVTTLVLFERHFYSHDYAWRFLDSLEESVESLLRQKDERRRRTVHAEVNFRVDRRENLTEEAVRDWVEAMSEDEARPEPTSEEAINALISETRSLSLTESNKNDNKDDTNNNTTCVICLEQLTMKDDDEEGGVARALRLPCKHEFHEGCIVEWLRTSHFCPLCRFELPTASST